MMRTAAVIVFASLALAGCSSVREAKISESFQMNYDEVVPVREAAPDGAIYSRANAGFFLGDRRAQRVGDLLTVKLDEKMNATKTDDSKLDRTGSLGVNLPKSLFGASPLALAAKAGDPNSLSTTSTFTGSGNANQSNSVTLDITVVVTRVYENGNLWVQGQKQITLNQGEEFVRVSGLIRPEDIQPGNTIDGQKIAQAQISYTGAGEVHDASKEGWMMRTFGLLSPI